MNDIEIIGDYNMIPETMSAEGVLELHLQPIDLMTYWRRCGLIADFSAKFYSYSHTPQNESFESTLSQIINEMVENAAKFSKQRESNARLTLKHYINLVSIEMMNEAMPHIAQSFKEHVINLIHGDLEEMYINRISSKIDNDTASGTGLLLILKDYNCKFGAKFEKVAGNSSAFYRIYVKIILRVED